VFLCVGKLNTLVEKLKENIARVVNTVRIHRTKLKCFARNTKDFPVSTKLQSVNATLHKRNSIQTVLPYMLHGGKPVLKTRADLCMSNVLTKHFVRQNHIDHC
jgi:hypothetical protein